ncbi:NAD(P)H-binding protein [Arthrobacter sp. Soc17.1.1.1]|uniref:NmrA family NAD(P)-binding protein n=1 Tax=Arthrobacter sp. Soc17.1.1.1 TaxID=3121277 RepID=UPI002FE4F83A
MIVITGATGTLNGTTVDHLLTRVPASEIVVVARDITKAQRFADAGVQVRPGDYASPAGLPAAFAGADQLLLVSSSDPKADAVALHRNAIEAAVEVGVGRVLYTSHQGAAPNTPFAPGRDHYATEQILADSGLAWTSLRNGFYAHSLNQIAGPWRDTGRISVPADGPVSWTAREDAAEAAAVVMTSGRTFDGPTTLTAPAAVSFGEIAAIASELSGRDIEFEVLDPDEWLAAMVTAGQAKFMARFILGMYQAAQEGFFSGVDPLLGDLLDRAPRSAQDALMAAPAYHH